MILTVTMNPSVDISYHLNDFLIDDINRVKNVKKTAGGKGLNVTRVLSEFKENVIATGLIGGTNGQFIRQNLPNNVIDEFYITSKNTRNCVAILHNSNQTEILESGPKISSSDLDNFFEHFKQLLKRVNIISLSGSLPTNVPDDFYIYLIKLILESNKKVVLDCSGNPLNRVLLSNFKPTVIKPNIDELSQLLNKKVETSITKLKSTLNESIFKGIEWIIVSLGADGMFAKHGNKYYQVQIPKINVANPVGSGDSTVAGIVSGLLHDLSDEELLKRANTFGMLNAQEEITGHINLKNYQKLYETIIVKEV